MILQLFKILLMIFEKADKVDKIDKLNKTKLNN